MCPCSDSVLVSRVTIDISKGLKVFRHDDDGSPGSGICGMKRL